MAATYDPSWSEDRDRARFRLADRGPTIDGAFVLQDEEIEAQIGLSGSLASALPVLARVLSTAYGVKATEVTQAEVRRKYIDRSQMYKDLAETLQEELEASEGETEGYGVPRVGQLEEPDLTDYATRIGL